MKEAMKEAMKGVKKVQDLSERIGQVVESYDWENDADNMGVLIVVANEDAYKAVPIGSVKTITQALVNGMMKDRALCEIVVAAHDAFVELIAESVEAEKRKSKNEIVKS